MLFFPTTTPNFLNTDELRAIESLFQKSPAELKPYSYILVETLRGLVNNEDGQLRNLAYDVFELVFPYLDVVLSFTFNKSVSSSSRVIVVYSNFKRFR